MNLCRLHVMAAATLKNERTISEAIVKRIDSPYLRDIVIRHRYPVDWCLVARDIREVRLGWWLDGFARERNPSVKEWLQGYVE